MTWRRRTRYTAVHPAGPAVLTRTAASKVDRDFCWWRRCPPAPLTGGVHEVRGQKAAGCGQEASEEAKIEHGPSACCHARRVKVVARAIIAEPRPAGSEKTWDTLVAKLSPEDHTAVSSVVAAEGLVNATETEDESAPPPRLGKEFAPQMLFDTISSRRALSDPGNDGQRFEYLQSLIHIDVRQGKVAGG